MNSHLNVLIFSHCVGDIVRLETNIRLLFIFFRYLYTQLYIMHHLANILRLHPALLTYVRGRTFLTWGQCRTALVCYDILLT